MRYERSRDWRPITLFLGCLLSLALFTSWLLEPTRSWWTAVEVAVFRMLNGSLASGHAWRIFWAAANTRATDVVAALCMIGLFAHYMIGKGRDKKDSVMAIGILLTGLVIVSTQIGKSMAIPRMSPTMVYPDALRLSELVPWMPTKDSAPDSFPGDHTTILLICAGVVTFYLPRAYATAAWILAVVFSTPRLVSGAHWLTDDLVGSVAVSGVVLSCVFATPLHRILTERLERMVVRIRAGTRRGASHVVSPRSGLGPAGTGESFTETSSQYDGRAVGTRSRARTAGRLSWIRSTHSPDRSGAHDAGGISR